MKQFSRMFVVTCISLLPVTNLLDQRQDRLRDGRVLQVQPSAMEDDSKHWLPPFLAGLEGRPEELHEPCARERLGRTS
jgi:hypothetical protein